jgi:hypothetical protein
MVLLERKDPIPGEERLQEILFCLFFRPPTEEEVEAEFETRVMMP